MSSRRFRRQGSGGAGTPRVRSAVPIAWVASLILIAGALLVQPRSHRPEYAAGIPSPGGRYGGGGATDPEVGAKGDGEGGGDGDGDGGGRRSRSGRGGGAASPALERGKPISDRVTAEELYDAYEQIREEYNAKAFTVEDEDRSSLGRNGGGDCGSSGRCWRVLKETADGIQIAMLNHPSDPNCPYVRMRAVMPGTVEDVWDFLSLSNWERTMPKMDPFYEGLTVLGKYTHRSIDMVLARKKTKRIVTFGKRDFTFVSVSDVPRHDGVWVSGTVSVVTPKFPRERGYTRAFQDSVAFYEPLDPDPRTGEPRTALTIVCRIDLNDSGEGGDGGMIPMWIYTKTIGATGLLSIGNMRKELEIDVANRKRREEGQKKRRAEETRCPLVPWVESSRNEKDRIDVETDLPKAVESSSLGLHGLSPGTPDSRGFFLQAKKE